LLATFYSLLFTCKTQVFEVEPKGLEPLAFAVQSQGTIIVDVRRRSKTPANKYVLP
jgi:hypothetical protein